MTNTKLLENEIVRSGKKKSYLAEKVGLSKAGFRNCMVNKAEFKASHIAILIEELKITDFAKVRAIFFTKLGA